MSSAEFIARIFGPLYVIVAVGMLLDAETYRQITKDALGKPVLRYLAGILALVAGLLIINVHNEWAPRWTVIITLMGWLALIKGALLTAYPDVLIRVSEPLARRSARLRGAAVVTLALGLFLTGMGYLGT